MDASCLSLGQLIFNVRFQFIKRIALDWLTGVLSLGRLPGLSLAREILVCDYQRIP
jgi:hypothetical protein